MRKYLFSSWLDDDVAVIVDYCCRYQFGISLPQEEISIINNYSRCFNRRNEKTRLLSYHKLSLIMIRRNYCE